MPCRAISIDSLIEADASKADAREVRAVGCAEGTLYQFVKSQPLRSAALLTQARPASASPAHTGRPGPGGPEERCLQQTAAMRLSLPPAARPVTAVARGGHGRAPVDRVQLYGSEPAVDLQTINGRPQFQYTRTKRLPLTHDGGEYLLIEPAVIHFEGFLNLGQKHFARVQLSNVSGVTRKIQVLPAQSRFFVVHSSNRRRLAPGLSTHVQIVFTPLEKRSYYDCIRIKTDDGQREYLLPLHAYPGRRMVLEHVPAPLPPRAKNWTQVQDVWRLEQFALTAVDTLRSGMSQARIKVAEMSAARANRSRQGLDDAGKDDNGVEGGHRAQPDSEDEEEYARALDEMQAEMQELEKEIFLGPGVEMGHANIFVGDTDGAALWKRFQAQAGLPTPGRPS
jgi:hypothetical protein